MKLWFFFRTFILLFITFMGCSIPENRVKLINKDQIYTIDDKKDDSGYLQSDIVYDLIPCESDFEGTLKHLMYKKSIGMKWYANCDLRGYEYFLNEKNKDNWKEKEKEHIFLMEYWSPPVENIKNIVFLTAGQQGSLIDRMDPENIITGQYKDYHHYDEAPLVGINTWKYFKNATRKIKWKSLAGQIIADGTYNNGEYFGFTKADTYLVLAFDSCNYWDLSANQKQDLAIDFLEWIFSKVNKHTSTRLMNIYLAGSSMGGALCVTIAYKMRHTQPWSDIVQSAKVIVSLMDAVANHVDGEVWTTSDKINNPNNSFYFCYKSDLSKFFTSLHNTYIYQVAGGSAVLPVIGVKYHAFYFNPNGVNLYFKWVNRDHFEIGREWNNDTIKSQLIWLADTINMF